MAPSRAGPSVAPAGRFGHRAAVFPAEDDRAVRRGVHRVVGGLEPEQEHAAPGRDAGRQESLDRVQQPGVGGVEPGLGHRAGRVDGSGVVGEVHRRAAPPAWALLQAHPRLGDDTEDAFGAEEQLVR